MFQKGVYRYDMLLKEEMPPSFAPEPAYLSCLPMAAELQNGRAVIIDYMTEAQLTETYFLIQEAAQNGDGFGIDEFDSEKSFRDEISGSDCFAVTCKENGDLLGGFILAVSKFYRGQSGVVDPFIIVKRSERNQKLGEFCMRKAIQFSRKLGYIAMYVDTFSNNIAMQRILEKIDGLNKVGFLPLGGRMKDGKMVGSLIYYMDLTTSETNET
ncbi:hypothetical protein FSP39_004332 [Pinctada imbricata]|uniref:N-acetyltransferase domain-containing protein n=1 Tax=Pinctada imbricata TaxID=66713 RepID=A0AA88XKV9_PINIB|nr:hypothetical protein FSP39_004332 [Pinctada imbricata]